MPLWTPVLDIAADVVLPRFCVGCGLRRTSWCTSCRAAARNRAPPALMAGFNAQTGELPIAAAGLYELDLRRAVLAFKSSGSRELGRELGVWLAGSILHLLSATSEPLHSRVRLVPVPASPASRVRRWGVDCVHVLLTAAVAQLQPRHSRPGQPHAQWHLSIDQALRVRGWASGQKGRSGDQRRTRSPRFTQTGEPKRLAQCAVIVVDDVVTTGATVHSCARTLARGGARVIGAAAVARTPEPGAPRPPHDWR